MLAESPTRLPVTKEVKVTVRGLNFYYGKFK